MELAISRDTSSLHDKMIKIAREENVYEVTKDMEQEALSLFEVTDVTLRNYFKLQRLLLTISQNVLALGIGRSDLGPDLVAERYELIDLKDLSPFEKEMIREAVKAMGVKIPRKWRRSPEVKLNKVPSLTLLPSIQSEEGPVSIVCPKCAVVKEGTPLSTLNGLRDADIGSLQRGGVLTVEELARCTHTQLRMMCEQGKSTSKIKRITEALAEKGIVLTRQRAKQQRFTKEALV